MSRLVRSDCTRIDHLPPGRRRIRCGKPHPGKQPAAKPIDAAANHGHQRCGMQIALPSRSQSVRHRPVTCGNSTCARHRAQGPKRSQVGGNVHEIPDHPVHRGPVEDRAGIDPPSREACSAAPKQDKRASSVSGGSVPPSSAARVRTPSPAPQWPQCQQADIELQSS